MIEVYERFDGSGDKDEMREFELARCMKWLGVPLSAGRRKELWLQVDLDKSNKIDSHEFLKLVHLLREDEMKAAKEVLESMESKCCYFEEAQLKDFLASLGYFPPKHLR